MTTSIVIPNYNGFDLLHKNLPKVISAIGKKSDVSIVIVDDCSHSDEQKKLDEFFQDFKSDVLVTVLKHAKNQGFSSTVNTGAFHIPADVYIFLNTDVVPEKGFVEKTLKHFQKNENLFGVGFMDRSKERSGDVFRGRGIGTWHHGLLTHSRGDVDKTNTLWVSGGSSGIRGSFFRNLKGLDPLYNPFYWEDIDLSFRAQKRGYEVLFDQEIIVDHYHDEGAIKKNFKKKRIMTIAYRNQFTFHWKNITDSQLIISHICWLPMHIGSALIHGDTALLLGLVQALVRIPRILKQRHQSKHIISDSRIINQKW